jgi:hypothetical protein
MNRVVLFLFLLICQASFGQRLVSNFALINVSDSTTVSLDSFSTDVAVIFTSNECAFDRYYHERIRALVGTYSGKIQFLLVNSYVELPESPMAMKEKHKTWSLQVPYLADKEQVVMTLLGAKKTPEVFLLHKSGGAFSISYHGPIDDNPQVASDVKQNYLKVSIDKLLAGQPLDAAEVRVIGCTIRKK